MQWKYYWILLFFLFAEILAGQQRTISPLTPSFDHLGVQDGLSQSSVLSIHQDTYGFMWFGTRDGLNRYDGYSFEVYKHLIADPLSIGGNIVHDIKEDQDGTLWMITEKGLSVFDRNRNNFVNYNYLDPKTPIGKSNTLFIDSRNRIWIGGVFGLYIFERASNSFVKPDIVSGVFSKNKNFNVNAIAEDETGNLWIGTGNFGLYQMDPNLEAGRKVQFPEHAAIASRIEVLEVSGKEGIWLGTYGDGLFFYDFSGKITLHYSADARISRQIANNNIRALLVDNEHRLWVGTFEGLTILDSNGNPFKVPFEKEFSKGLAHNSIRSLSMDDKKSVWVGTYFGGINIYDKDNQRFLHFQHSVKNLSSLSFDVVGAFAEDKNGNLFIGTERGGVNFVRKDAQKHQVLDAENHSKSTVKALYSDSGGRKWAGIFKQGLHQYDAVADQWRQFPGENSKNAYLRRAIINRIVEDDDGFLWLATDAMGGLQRFDPEKGKYVDFPFKDQLSTALGHSVVKDVLLKKDRKIVLATKGNGIVEFNPENGMLAVIKEFDTKEGKIKIDHFNSVFLDSQNRHWYSSNGGGLLMKENEESEYVRFGTENGLSNDVIYGCLESKKGVIWAITLNGISKIDTENGVVDKSYTSYSGFPLDEINEGAYYKTNDNRFIIGGNNGYTIFNPDNLVDNDYVPKMVFTGIKVMNKPISPEDGSKVLDTEINTVEQITLRHFQSVLTLEFAALSYLKPENNQYRYKLEGFDEDWIDSGNKQSVTYTNLKSGEYTFLVKGSNNDGVWTGKPMALQINVLPPPWRTWWAYLFYALAIIGVAFLIRGYTLKSERLKQNLRIEQLEKDKWKEIHDLKLEYFIDVSHEFRTPLALILNPLEEIMSIENKEPRFKGLIKNMYLNAKRLQLLIDQILEIREIETGHLKLKNEALHLNWHVEEIFNSFTTIADKQNIKLTLVKNDIPEIPVLFDRDKIEKIFYNLLSNAFKFTKRGGEISLKIKALQKDKWIHYHFQLEDTGIGIPSERLPHIFERFQKNQEQSGGAGIGLALTKSLIELMKGAISVRSEVDKGTVFDLYLRFETVDGVVEEEVSKNNYNHPVPLEYSVPGHKADEEVVTDRKSGPSILIAEDNAEMMAYLKNQLGKAYNILTAENGKSAYALIEKYGPELVISDVMMPEMDGLELCNKVKTSKAFSHIPIILLTARNAQYNRIEGLEQGADDYISKPFNLTELKLKVKNLLKNKLSLQKRFQELSTPMLPKEKLLHPFDEKLMKSVINIIQKNIDQPNFTVETLGKEVGLSRVHLFRKLKSLTGKTPSDFIRNIRMKNACELLELGSYRTAEVAYMVGFQDVKYFSKCFKKITRMSPKQYRQSVEDKKNLETVSDS